MPPRKKQPPLPFNKRLVLNQYILSLFGIKSFEDIALHVNKTENEGWTEDRISLFHHAVVQALPMQGAQLSPEILLGYDQNIVSHTLAIQGKRPKPIRWKYFQYLALLFTEIYLDRYMNDPKNFANSLNMFLNGQSVNAMTGQMYEDEAFNYPLGGFNARLPAKEKLSLFTEDDLRKIAFWSATGSGKTLIMHMNIKQYLHYLKKSARSRELNRILLVTPNEGLSKQHKDEFELSGIQSTFFSKQVGKLAFNETVEIIEVTKLADVDGDKTVALEAFEGNNLVLADEGHRGASGKVWSQRRRKLAEKGFTFEYSATLGQAVAGDAELSQEYAKSIVFDYSYRYFYGDGYGKDYRILNLPDDNDENARVLYLTACLLTFYQQKMLFKDPQAKVKQFNIENPLWVFVGSSVTKSTSKKDISDAVDIVQFLARFTASSNKQSTLQLIARLRTY